MDQPPAAATTPRRGGFLSRPGTNLDVFHHRLTSRGYRVAADRRLPPWVVVLIVAVVIVGVGFALDGASTQLPAALPDWAVAAFRVLTRMGESVWYLVPTGILVLLALFADWRAAGRDVRAAWAELTALALYYFLAVGTAALVVNAVKPILGRARPALFDEVGFALVPFSFDYLHASFPSGHSTTAGAAMIAASLIAPRLAPLFVTVGVAIGFSRIAVGAHYPSDVLAGLTLGGVTAWGMARLFARRRYGFQPRAGRLRARTTAIRLLPFRRLVAGLPRALVGR